MKVAFFHGKRLYLPQEKINLVMKHLPLFILCLWIATAPLTSQISFNARVDNQLLEKSDYYTREFQLDSLNNYLLSEYQNGNPDAAMLMVIVQKMIYGNLDAAKEWGDKAITCYKEQITQGNLEATLSLMSLLSTPFLGEIIDLPDSIDWEALTQTCMTEAKKKAAQGDTKAMIQLGLLHGDSTEYWLKRAAEGGNTQAYRELELHYWIHDDSIQGSFWRDKYIKVLKSQAQAGDYEAMVKLQKEYRESVENEKDTQIYWARRAAQAGKLESMEWLYKHLADSTEREMWEKKWVKAMTAKAESGNPMAMFHLVTHYGSGRFLEVETGLEAEADTLSDEATEETLTANDTVTPLQYNDKRSEMRDSVLFKYWKTKMIATLEPLSQNGNILAESLLLETYQGDNDQANYTRLVKRKAERGEKGALEEMIQLTQDSQEKSHWQNKLEEAHEASANAGNAEDMIWLYYQYSGVGDGAVIDTVKSQYWFKKAESVYIVEAQKGNTAAMSSLADLYQMHGDKDKQLFWQEKLVRSDSNIIYWEMATLADLYFEKKQYANAIEWYLKTIEALDETEIDMSGYMLRLAWCYNNGVDVKKNAAEAEKWLKKYAETSQCTLEEARKRMKEIPKQDF